MAFTSSMEPLLLNCITFLAGAFIGFAIGRFGDLLGGHWDGPHHWIYGLLVIFAGFYVEGLLGVFLIAAGIGCFISDLNDFLHFRFWGTDIPHKWKFWSIL